MLRSFTKQERLCSEKAIETLMHKGKRFSTDFFRITYRSHSSQDNNCGTNGVVISVPKKIFKHAVDRNLLKRRIRESYRLNKELLKIESGYVDLMVVYNCGIIMEYAAIEEEIRKILLHITASQAKKQ